MAITRTILETLLPGQRIALGTIQLDRTGSPAHFRLSILTFAHLSPQDKKDLASSEMELIAWVKQKPKRFLLSEFSYPSEPALREGFHKMVASIRGEEMGISGAVMAGVGGALILGGIIIAFTSPEGERTSHLVGTILASTGIVTMGMGQLIKSLKRVGRRIDAMREESRERHITSGGRE